jgi:hypothetical protein
MHHVWVNPLLSAFSPILGLPSWLVAKGHGSFVTLQFGEPQLVIREPRMQPLFIDGGPSRARTRFVHIRGQWHLWIYCCEWSLTLNGVQIAHCESDDVTIARALRVLNGQALTSVESSSADGSSTFAFDLGCVLRTHPAPKGTYSEKPVEQWMLFQPSGDVLTVRGDGQYLVRDGRQPNDDNGWEQLPADSKA